MNACIPFDTNEFNFENEVVEPYTLYPFEIKFSLKGKPSHPQPITVIFIEIQS